MNSSTSLKEEIKLTFFQEEEGRDEFSIATNYNEPNEEIIGSVKGKKFAEHIINALSLIAKNKPEKSIEQCKDEIAQKEGYGDWADFMGASASELSGIKLFMRISRVVNEAMQLYLEQGKSDAQEFLQWFLKSGFVIGDKKDRDYQIEDVYKIFKSKK